MKNYEIAWALQELADLLDLTGENPFKTRAYRMAARKIEGLSQEVEDLYHQNRLTEIDGIGDAIAKKIGELLSAGAISLTQRLKQEIPAGLFSILAVPGVGPKRAYLFHQELGITNISELKEAAQKRKLRTLKGMGNKVEDSVLSGIERIENPASRGRMMLGTASEFAHVIGERLRRSPYVVQVEVAGSLRRKVETIGDLDYVVATTSPEYVGELFRSFPEFTDFVADGNTKISAIHRSGFQVDLRLVSPKQFASALLHFTGSKEHNIRLRQIAKAKGYRLNEYGLVLLEDESQKVTPASEEQFYAFLGMPLIPPELREDRGEIESAQQGKIPSLVSLSEINGDLHVHSRWSDGSGTIEEIARAARNKGYAYIAICDHSRSLKVAHGLDLERLEAQHAEVAELNAKGELGIKILTGVEVDILNDGMDWEDSILANIDIVVASIHSGFRQPLSKIMARIERALRNPNVDILAHPTGRLLGRRDGYAVDMDLVIKLAAETGTALEINSYPDRLDMDDLTTRKAVEHGVMIAIDTDSHHVEQLDYMDFGVGVARRAWAGPSNILNCLDLASLQEWLNR